MVVLNCAHIEPCIEVIDYLARLRLGLKLAGYQMRLANVREDLRELLELCPLGVEVQGQAEEREEPGGVQEERDLPDTTA